MFHRILIANRGEIAVRIIRACHEMGIETIAIYSEEDRDSLHVRLADHSVCVGPAPSIKSYLNVNNILSAAVVKEADAIHPGFGFLSENHEFAKMCEDLGLKFIGPSADSIRQLGQKLMAKTIMKQNGLPSIPGTDEAFIDAKKAYDAAQEIGFPVVIKAVSGGGGRGIRLIHNPGNFIKTFQEASHEAKISFKDPFIYIEKFLENPKHIEFQMLGDEQGNCIHLGERDCSCQRRKQKVIEETPSPVISNNQREDIGKKITAALQNIGYYNAGTVEFLYENGNFYFMEMNTRIQVEHPITEITTGIDIVKEQIRIAAGEELLYKQSDIKMDWYAIECRINAENPDKNFMPSMGKIETVIFPGGPGVRVDSFVFPGYVITPYYDSMIAKLIAYDNTREKAIARTIRALDELEIEGININKEFLMKILLHDEFLAGSYSINFIENKLL